MTADTITFQWPEAEITLGPTEPTPPNPGPPTGYIILRRVPDVQITMTVGESKTLNVVEKIGGQHVPTIGKAVFGTSDPTILSITQPATGAHLVNAIKEGAAQLTVVDTLPSGKPLPGSVDVVVKPKPTAPAEPDAVEIHVGQTEAA